MKTLLSGYDAIAYAERHNDAVAKTLDGRNHFCHDENATIANGRWLCGCPGGPFIAPCISTPIRPREPVTT